MSGNDAEHLTPEERADIFRRLQEMELQKKMKQVSALEELKREFGIPGGGGK